MNAKILIVVASACMAGCTTSTNINIYHNLHIAGAVGSEVVPVAVAAIAPAVVASTAACPVFVMPDLGATPPLPLAELDSISSGDHDGIDIVHQKHIKQLRLYIIDIKEKLYRAQLQYRKMCGF